MQEIGDVPQRDTLEILKGVASQHLTVYNNHVDVMKMKRISRLVLFCSFTINILLLGVLGQDKVRVKAENGVQVIINPIKPTKLPGVSSKMKIEKELSIGKSSGRDEYMFGEARGVVVDDSGSIFIEEGQRD
jgi:hypothetical protein